MIKNLAELKRAMNEKKEFRIVRHYTRPECTGQTRKPNIVQTNGMYTVVPNEPSNKVNTYNNGKGSWVDFGKASDWIFEDGQCTYAPKYKNIEQYIWTIELV